jgi:hypothetical protein
LSRQRAADYLGVSVRTIRHWDAGRNRVPWSVVRLLRLVRAGELGGLDDAWEGWTISRHGLRAPCGRVYTQAGMRHWWLTCEYATLFHKLYTLERTGGVGRSPADTPLTSNDQAAAMDAGRVLSSELPGPCPTRPTAFSASPADKPGKAAFAVLPSRSEASPQPAASPADSLPIACACTGEMAQSNCVASGSGCTLPRDVSVLSDCRTEPPQTQAQPYVAVLPLHALACPSGPESNTGLASNQGASR